MLAGDFGLQKDPGHGVPASAVCFLGTAAVMCFARPEFDVLRQTSGGTQCVADTVPLLPSLGEAMIPSKGTRVAGG